MNVATMKSRLAEINQALDNEEDVKALDALISEAEQLKIDLDKAEESQIKAQALKQSLTSFNPKTISGNVSNMNQQKQNSFQSAGEFFHSLYKSNGDYSQDGRLHNIAKIMQTSGVATTAQDGLLIPADIAPEINVLGKGVTEDWLGKMNIQSTSSNAKQFNRSAATTRGGSTGLVCARVAENTQLTSSRETFEKTTATLEKLFVYAEVTEEDLEDLPFLQSYIMNTAPELFKIQVMKEFLDGTGAGQALGMFNTNNANKIAVTRTIANTIKAEDVVNMMSRHIKGANSFWLVAPSVWSKLPLMQVGDQPVFQPDFTGGIQGRLLGLPIFTSEDCEALGTAGDIRLINPDGYIGLQKVGGMKSEMSAHVKFDYDRMAFKFTFRITGLPIYNAAYTPRKGSTLSHFVQVAS